MIGPWKMKPVAVAVFDVTAHFHRSGQTFYKKEAVTLFENAKGKRKAEGDYQVCKFAGVAIWLAGGPLPPEAVKV